MDFEQIRHLYTPEEQETIDRILRLRKVGAITEIIGWILVAAMIVVILVMDSFQTVAWYALIGGIILSSLGSAINGATNKRLSKITIETVAHDREGSNQMRP